PPDQGDQLAARPEPPAQAAASITEDERSRPTGIVRAAAVSRGTDRKKRVPNPVRIERPDRWKSGSIRPPSYPQQLSTGSPRFT
ncbi:hypothetical protein ACFWC6_24150, partial [Micromonospora chalcea]